MFRDHKFKRLVLKHTRFFPDSMSLFLNLLFSYQYNIMAYDLELHAIEIKRSFGMQQPHVRCFL